MVVFLRRFVCYVLPFVREDKRTSSMWDSKSCIHSYVQVNVYVTTLSLLKLAISLSPIPTISLNISSVCWPNVGGGVLMLGSEYEYLTGVLTNFIVPHVGCSTSLTISRASTVTWGVKRRLSAQ